LDRLEGVKASNDSDGSAIPEEIKDREYRLKRLEEARKQLGGEKNTKGYIPDNKLESLDGKKESESYMTKEILFIMSTLANTVVLKEKY